MSNKARELFIDTMTQEEVNDYLLEHIDGSPESIHALITQGYEISFEVQVDAELMKRLFGYEDNLKNDVYDFSFSYLVPRRTHKKRRIAKKWLKRYGYKEKIFSCPARISPTNPCDTGSEEYLIDISLELSR